MRLHGRKCWGATDKVTKERCMEVHKKRKSKRCKYHKNKKINEQFGRKLNQDVDGNKLFWKEVSKVNGGKAESYSRIKNRNERLAVGGNEV